MTQAAPVAHPKSPERVACIDLINSTFTHYLGTAAGFDRLPAPRMAAWFLERYGLTIHAGATGTRQEAERSAPSSCARCLRSGRRRTRSRSATSRSSTAGSGSVPLRRRVTIAAGRPTLTIEPVTRDWDWAMARIAASAAILLVDHASERLKTCANPECSWMFYDNTLNRSRRFSPPPDRKRHAE